MIYSQGVSVLNKLSNFFWGLVPYLFIFLLFKGCTYVFGPSDEEKKRRIFFNEELINVESAERVVRLCSKDDYKGQFLTNEGITLNCKDSEEKIIKIFLENLNSNKEYQAFITNAKPEWIKEIADLKYDHSGDSIDSILTFAERSVAYCSVTIKVRSKKNKVNQTDIFDGCTRLAKVCIKKLENLEKNIDFPCEPVSGTLAQLYIKEFSAGTK
jgi:hypothetical protein